MSVNKCPGVIRKLEEVVINRIAAGEVIQRPANALKELLENCLDAGANNVQVLVKSGGMKLLQIQDDGWGIRKDDLPILCERFTTSKLQTFEDLHTIGTYGFRGEALASISHVSHLTIITRTNDSPCAYRAEYSNGKLVDNGSANPKACAGNQGTIITVEDLFYNMESRRLALKNASEEYSKILEVVTRYSLHNCKVGFSLKKEGENNNDLRTPPNSTVADNIRLLYGMQIARELIPSFCEDGSYNFKMSSLISNGNYSMKKSTFILFINNRLVESSGMKKALDGIYSAYLPKGSHPFIYLSLEVEPRNVDVNVHPTKHEVHFLHEDAIISIIGNSIDKILQGSNQSRTFYIQSLLPGAAISSTVVKSSESKNKKGSIGDHTVISTDKDIENSSSLAPKFLVRTDPKEQTLEKFLTKMTSDTSDNVPSSQTSRSGLQTPNSISSKSTCMSIERRNMNLDSVKILCERIKSDCHNELLTTFRNHSFIGCVDRTHALIQHDTKLYMANSVMISKELFYQKLMLNFGNISCLHIEDPIPIHQLLAVALKEDESNDLTDETSDPSTDIAAFLQEKAPMLDDYFSLKISEDGFLHGIPLLLENYIPSLELVPFYLLNLAKRVNWESEIECFQTFCQETANFYAIVPGDDVDIEEKLLNGQTWKWTIEHVIYPELKRFLFPSRIWADDSTVVELADLPTLYKVFERC